MSMSPPRAVPGPVPIPGTAAATRGLESRIVAKMKALTAGPPMLAPARASQAGVKLMALHRDHGAAH